MMTGWRFVVALLLIQYNLFLRSRRYTETIISVCGCSVKRSALRLRETLLRFESRFLQFLFGPSSSRLLDLDFFIRKLTQGFYHFLTEVPNKI